MRAPIAFVLAAVLIAAAATPALGFDGSKKGFILGFGLGMGVTSFKQTASVYGYDDLESARETKGGLATDFRIGAGLSEQVMIYYTSRVSWFSIENIYGNSVTIANGIGLACVSYYLQPANRGAYLLGILGIASWNAPFEEDSDGLTGLGFGGGVGYEFAPHWSVEGVLGVGSPSETISGVELTTDAVMLQFTVNGVAF